MALTIALPEIEKLAQELAEQTGESIDDAVGNAIRERLTRYARTNAVHAALVDFRAQLKGLPVADPRSADEILGYDEFGLPH